MSNQKSHCPANAIKMFVFFSTTNGFVLAIINESENKKSDDKSLKEKVTE